MGFAIEQVFQQKMFPSSIQAAFGESFGTVAFLFCINFLTFPIMNSMKEPKEYKDAVPYAVWGTAIFNIVFAALCVGFYGENTADLVLSNLGNGTYLSALKILLCIDLLFTFPIVFSSGRQILENVLLDESGKEEGEETMSLALSRAAITGGAVATCFGLSQVGGFGVVANLVGGVAQGTLAFIIPPAITISLQRRAEGINYASEIPQWLVGIFGAAVVTSVTYFTIAEA